MVIASPQKMATFRVENIKTPENEMDCDPVFESIRARCRM